MEDILTLIDGRDSLVQEISDAHPALATYIKSELSELLEHPQFEYAIQAAAGGNTEREKIIFERILKIISGLASAAK